MAPLRRPPDRAAPGEFRDETPTLRGDTPTRKMRARPEPPQPGQASPLHAAPAGDPPSVHERLLVAARERFSTDGYENATTAAIARQAGTSESQLVKHFGSKEGLLEAIFDQAWGVLEAQAKQAVREQSTPLSGLLATSDVVTRAMERDRQLRSLLLLEGRRIRRNGHEVVISAGFRRFVALVDDLFHQLQETGDLAADADLEAVRSAWMGALEGLVRDQLLAELIGYPAGFNRKVQRRTALTVLSAFLMPRAQRMLHALSQAE